MHATPSGRLNFRKWCVSSKWFLAAAAAFILGVVWRIPLYSNAESLIWSDEAANHLTLKLMLQTHELYYFYLGMRYQGLTEGLFSLLFVPFFGFSALSQKLAGSVTYFLFATLAISFLFRTIRSTLPRIGLLFLAVAPPAHLYHLSFMAYGGHLLNGLLGFLLLHTVFRFHQEKRTHLLRFPIIISAIIALGIYTFRHYLIFYPALFLSLFLFRGGHSIFSRIHVRNIGLSAITCAVWPGMNQRLGQWLQGRSYESYNSFMTFSEIHWNNFERIVEKAQLLFFELWPATLLTAGSDWKKTLSALFAIASLLALAILFIFKMKEKTEAAKFLKLSLFHIAVVFASVLLTPYAVLPMDVRYLAPIYSIIPFVLSSLAHYASKTPLPKKICTVGLFLVPMIFALNTLAFNNQNGLMLGIRAVKNSPPYLSLISRLKEKQIHCLYMDYPDAYSLTLFTQEEIKATALHFPRIRRYEECAEAEKPRTVVLRKDNPDLSLFLQPEDKESMHYAIQDRVDPFLILRSVE